MKTMIWTGLGVGSTIGGALPMLWDPNGVFSMSSVILTFVGGILGIWAGFQVGKYMGL